MLGKVFFMEFLTSWKGILIFSFIVLLTAGGMPQIYPTFKETLEGDLEGEENLNIEIPAEKGENIKLSWTPQESGMSYIIVESNLLSLFPPTGVIIANNSNVSIPYDFNETRYYAVSTLNITGIDITEYLSYVFNITELYNHKFSIKNLSNTTFIGMTSTSKDKKSAFDEILDNPAYKSLTGGRVTSMAEIEGFISLEFFSWWIFLAGLFFAYISVSSLTDGFEGKHMDLIFSTPISRQHYLLEKFAALIVIAFFILLVVAGAMAGGIEQIGYSHELSSYTVFLAIIGSLPMLSVIMAIGFLSAVVFRSTRAGMGIAFLFVMVEFILFTVASLVGSLEGAKYATIMHYWDYNSVLYDGLFKTADFIGLFVVTGVILMLAIYVFKKKDIPA